MESKSTKTLGYSLKGFLDKENLTITELSEEEQIVHDLETLFELFDGSEVSFSMSNKVKLKNGVE